MAIPLSFLSNTAFDITKRVPSAGLLTLCSNVTLSPDFMSSRILIKTRLISSGHTYLRNILMGFCGADSVIPYMSENSSFQLS